jgi:AcrR family transcriptional regulator
VDDDAKPSTSPRKPARQTRSQALVDAIVEAATRILPDRGLDGTTTNRIAELAGVSVGSLYQYFPNKDSIVATLIERDLAAQERTYTAMIDSMRDRPLADVIEAIVHHATDRYLAHPRLIRAVFVHAVRLRHLETILGTRKSIGAALARLIRERPAEVSVDDPEGATFVLINAVMGVYQTWVFTDPAERMSTAEVNRHLTRMILGYLRG